MHIYLSFYLSTYIFQWTYTHNSATSNSEGFVTVLHT